LGEASAGVSRECLKATRGAFRAACAGVTAVGPVDYPASSSPDVEPKDGDLVLEPGKVRNRRLRSSVLDRSRLIQHRLGSSGARWRGVFLTATYANEDDFAPGQVSALVEHIRKWGKRRGITIPGIWVLERGEEGGRLHYHLVLWLPKGLTLPKPDKQGWWTRGSTNIQWAKHPPVGYLAKYVGKGCGPDESHGLTPRHGFGSIGQIGS
jgi:hypothetical protein